MDTMIVLQQCEECVTISDNQIIRKKMHSETIKKKNQVDKAVVQKGNSFLSSRFSTVLILRLCGIFHFRQMFKALAFTLTTPAVF